VCSMDEAALRNFRWREASLVTQGAMNALNPVLTIGEQISDVLEVREGRSRRAARARVTELLELVGLGGTRPTRYPHELSGGMRQRVVIAMALALTPPLVILDEPTTALDVVVQKEIWTEIAELNQRLGLSILFISHDLSLMMEICSHVGVMYAGRLVEIAPARELLAHPRHPYTQGLLNAFPDLHAEPGRLIGI